MQCGWKLGLADKITSPRGLPRAAEITPGTVLGLAPRLVLVLQRRIICGDLV